MSNVRRQPDFHPLARDKTTQRDQRIGAAWTRDSGRISIVLDPLVVLSRKDEMLLSLFINDPALAKKRQVAKAAQQDDDIPF